jgi:hypothetical protein
MAIFNFKHLLIPVTLLAVAACNTTHQPHLLTLENQSNHICQGLKHDILMDSVKGREEGGDNPIAQARLYKEYDKYHCDAVLRQNTERNRLRMPS